MSEKQEQKPPPGAGCNLDVQIARKLGFVWTTKIGGLGYEVSRWTDLATGDDAYPGCEWDQPEYSTSWEAAMQIAEFVYGKNFTFKLKRENFAGWWECEIRNGLTFGWRREDTGPMAICRAFLALPDFEVKE